MKYYKILSVLIIVGIFISCETDKPKDIKKIDTSQIVELPETPMITYSLVNTYPHDINAFTEGFLFH